MAVSYLVKYRRCVSSAKLSDINDHLLKLLPFFVQFKPCVVMTRKTIKTLFIVLIFKVVIIGVLSEKCSLLCDCDIWYELQYASCVGRHLYSIHTGAPSTVQALDLSNNSISILNNYELADAGMLKLKYLNLSTNAISEIGLNAFDGLSELTVLDLSQNHLYYLLSDIFISAKKLRILRLSNNNFNSHIPKLRCPWLTDLTLSSCQISYIPMDAFFGLSHLRNLDLSNNLMIQLNSIVFDRLKFLKTLSIKGNPWSCDKFMRNLQIYLNHRNIQYYPLCTQDLEPKRFEKMIVYNPHIKHEKYPPPITVDTNIKKHIITTKKYPVFTPIYKNTNACVNATTKMNFTKTLNIISPYWFFIIGFLLGSACGMFTCYIWLTKKISCCCRRRDNDAQRISLLQSLWQFEDSTFHRDAMSCPETPPPPYREVMLRPRLYHNQSIMTNLNNNAATNNIG